MEENDTVSESSMRRYFGFGGIGICLPVDKMLTVILPPVTGPANKLCAPPYTMIVERGCNVHETRGSDTDMLTADASYE